jgi:hypothetical protein
MIGKGNLFITKNALSIQKSKVSGGGADGDVIVEQPLLSQLVSLILYLMTRTRVMGIFSLE